MVAAVNIANQILVPTTLAYSFSAFRRKMGASEFTKFHSDKDALETVVGGLRPGNEYEFYVQGVLCEMTKKYHIVTVK